MSVAALVDGDAAAGQTGWMRSLLTELFPHPRSLTGDGVRRTLRALARDLPLELHEVPSGTTVFDWTVPEEWTVREAWLADASGHRIVDVASSPLHLVGYSSPVRARLSLAELRPHLHSLPSHPDWVPYRTSYYAPGWGFCLSHRVLQQLDDGPYDVVVDTTLAPGALSYGQCLLPGSSAEEVLVSTHVCHPAMANDNLSGIAVAAALARLLAGASHRLSYRFVFVPGTIGSLTWLAQHPDVLPRVRHGVVLTGLGGPGPLHWKATRSGGTQVDAAAEAVVRARDGVLLPFSPWGYDERQYNAPGFDLPVGRLTRTPHGEYPQYHTSADDLAFVDDAALGEALAAALELVDVLEHDAPLLRAGPPGEPQLGRRGLYPSVGGRSADREVMALLWTLAMADGRHSMLDVAERAGIRFCEVRGVAATLRRHGLLAAPAEQTTGIRANA